MDREANDLGANSQGQKNKYSVFRTHIAVMSVVIVAVALSFIHILFRTSISENVQNRASEELETNARNQAILLKSVFSDQFECLDFLSSYIHCREDFLDADNRELLETVISTYDLNAVVFATKDGDACYPDGTFFANLKGISVFDEIVPGGQTQAVVYQDAIEQVPQLHFVFSEPVMRDGELQGVLLASKFVDHVQNKLFKDGVTNSETSVFLIDCDGKILAANPTGRERISEDTLLGEPGNAFFDLDGNRIDLADNMEQGKSGTFQCQMDRLLYAAYQPVQINRWYIVCMTDKESLPDAYRGNIELTQKLIRKIGAGIVLLLLYILIFTLIYVRDHFRDEHRLRIQMEKNQLLFRNLNCDLVTLDLRHDTAEVVGTRNGIVEGFKGSLSEFEETIRDTYADLDLKNLHKQIRQVRETRESARTELLLRSGNGFRWLELTFTPFMNHKGTVNEVLVSIQDMSGIHTEFENAMRLLSMAPVGIYRYNLQEPMRPEFVSDGLYKKLGYTMEEIRELARDGMEYLVVEDEREAYRNFVHHSVIEQGIATLEYHMVCKDGSVIHVTDTMEAMPDAKGTLYGYAAVTDISGYANRDRALMDVMAKLYVETRAHQDSKKRELALEKELNLARIKNSTSQMQPHFLYNALGSIREIILEDPQYASDLICDFTTHLRACVRAMSTDDLIPFEKELDSVMAYVNIEKMRFGDWLQVDYDIRTTDFKILPLTVQPLIENAIRHGVYSRGAQGGHVLLVTEETGDGIGITISDDGVGFDYEKLVKDVEAGERESTGLINTIFRLRQVLKATVYVDSVPDQGTTVSIRIPKRKEAES